MAQVFKKLMIPNISIEDYKIFEKELLLTNFYRTSSVTGAVKIEEIKDFCQTDLSTKNVALVYTGLILYVWIGEQSKWIEQKLAIETAMVTQYLIQKETAKKEAEKVIVTFEYQEPLEFKRIFQGWTKERFPQDKSDMEPSSTTPELFLKTFERKEYTKEELLQTDTLPQHLDRKNLEDYMSPDEFQRTFSIKKSEYSSLPQWKRQTLKRNAGF